MSTFNPTPSELALTSQVFTIADSQNLGIVTGDTAVKILSGANLSHVVLGEVWAIADKDNNGFLTKKGVAIALRLIGYAQKGEAVTEAMLNKPGPLAHIDGVSRPAGAISPPPSSPPSVPSSALPPLSQQDKTKFLKLFISCGPVNGFLSGEKARDVFVKSKLSYDKLSHIWTLADTKTRGALDSTDFTIGMYFIQASMSSPSLHLPSTLPSGIYDQAVQNLDMNSSVVNHATGSSVPSLGSPLQSSFHIPRQYTGSVTVALGQSTTRPQHIEQQLPQTPTRQSTSSFNRSTVSPSGPGSLHITRSFSQPWGVSPEAKASSDKFFDELDPQHRGYIEGDVAVPFMLGSKLPESELAQIWDLADLRNDGHLTRDGFAVAMHIIHSRLAGHEIPSILPPSLLPPSMRSSQPTMTAKIEPQLDLLLDDTSSGLVLQTQETGGSPQIPSPSPFGHNLGKDTFSSPYQAMVPLHTQQSSTLRPDTNKDLLGDDDDEASRPDSLPDNSAEIGNLRNQVSSTTRSLITTQAERASAEQTVTQQLGQLSQLQTQLSSARASYEIESQLLANLRERLVTQRIDIQKTRGELISAESELSATKVEKAEVEGSVLRDKEEIRDLQRRMKEVGAETDALKAGIEKAKKDVRQQKGLLAIARKQLATAETEKLRSTRELEVVQKELEVAQLEKKTIDEQLFELETAPSHTSDDFIHVDSVASLASSSPAAAIPLPDTPQSTTPQPLARLSTNPFERLAMAAMGATDASPPLQASSPATDDAPVEPSDIFILHSPPPSAETQLTQSSTGVGDIVSTSEPTISTASAGPGTDTVSQVSTSTPVDNDSSVIIPLSNGEQDVHKDFSEEQRLSSSVYPPVDEVDGIFGPLHEIENHGSDTSDSDEQPLGAKFSAKSVQGQFLSDGTPPSNLPPGLEPPTTFKSAFDDTFGAIEYSNNPPTTGKASPTTSGKSSPRRSRSPGRALSTRTLSNHSIAGALDPFNASTFSHTPLEPPEGHTVPPPTIETVLEPAAGTTNLTPSSINDFDEALGKLTTSTKDASPAFKLDSAFDDNFDFSSAVNGTTNEYMSLPDANTHSASSNVETATAYSPPATAPFAPSIEVKSQTTNPTTVKETNDVLLSSTSSTANGTASMSFDDAFGLNSSVISNDNGQQLPANGKPPVVDVFGGISEIFDPSTTGNTLSTAQPPKPVFVDSLSSPLSAQPASPPIRPPSPPQRQVSAGTSKKAASPPRASSPKPRVSGSKTLPPEGKSETSSKHKLNIRFPFGRKDKSKDKEDKRGQSQAQQPPPDSQQLLSPVFEPSLPGTITPAVEDDAEQVKQMAAMGFSRTQSIAALEAHGYNLEKAVNSLLGGA